jgi:capsid protein
MTVPVTAPQGYAERFVYDFITELSHRKSFYKHQDKILASFQQLSSPIRSTGGTAYGGSSIGGGSKWLGGLSYSGRGRILNHYILRINAREAYHDVPQARAFVDRFADTVADTGLRLEATPKIELLGTTREEGELWAQDVEARFDLFMRDKRQHRSEVFTGYQLQRLYQIFQHRDNDIFIRLYYSRNSKLQNPLQFEFIDPDQIRGDAFTSTFGITGTEDGIERDKRGREVAYKIWIRDKSIGKYEDVTVKAKGPKSGRIMMLHGYSPEYAGQGRGYSRLAFALQEFQNLTDFSLAQIKKAINQSSIVAMMENKELNPSNPFEEILTNVGAGPASDQFGSVPNPAADALNVTSSSLLPPECYHLPEASLKDPGSLMIMNAQRGDTLKAFAQNAPADSFDKFVDAFTSYLCAAGSMPLEVLLMKFNSNFSASRGALLLFWRIVLIWRDEMAADFLNPLYEMWLSGEIAAGRVSAPGWSDPRLKQAWLSNGWIGSPAPDIDPSKTSKARKDNLEMGITNLDREARGLNGSDAKTNREKLKRSYEDFPVAPWSKAKGNGDGGNGDNPLTKDDVKGLISEILEDLNLKGE